jgi:Protein of unknown function (DUF3754)
VQHYDQDGYLKWDLSAKEHHIPLHTTDLIEFLARRPVMSNETAHEFRQIATLILAIEHNLYRQRHAQLLYNYAPLDPNLDRMLASLPENDQREIQIANTRTQVEEALVRANYRKLNTEETFQTLQAASRWGVRMRVNFELQEWMDIYTRGFVLGKRRQRSWRKFYRYQECEVPLYQRLVVIFRAKADHPQKFNSGQIYLRMFKNVPRHDIDMMLPGAGIRMTWVDHSKIVLPSVYTAAVTLWRVLKYFLMLTLLGALKTVGIIFISLLAIGYGIKNMFSFRSHTRQRYLLNMTQNLYYQSLGNNMAVLLRLLEEGEQQEACQAILTYFVALESAFQPQTWEKIHSRCGELLLEATGVFADLDTQACLNNLQRLRLLALQDGKWLAVPTAAARQQLELVWNEWSNSD